MNDHEAIERPDEFADDREMDESANATVGAGTPDTAPNEPVRLTLWERLSRRFRPIPEEEDQQ